MSDPVDSDMPATVPRAILIGLIAILLWSTTVGLLRSVSEAFGATGGAALIYTTTALLLCLTRGLPKLGAMPAAYLAIGGISQSVTGVGDDQLSLALSDRGAGDPV